MCALSSTLLLSVTDGIKQLSCQEKKTSCYDLLTQEVLKETIKNVKEHGQTYALGVGALQLLGRVVKILSDKIVDLELFDGLLSDRACQVRAAVVMSHYLTLTREGDLELITKKIDLLIGTLLEKQAELKSKSPVLLLEKITRGKLLEKVGQLEISSELLQMTQLCLLHEIREFIPKQYKCHDCDKEVQGFREETKHTKLQSYFDPDHIGLKALVERTKVLICEVSIRQFQRMAKTASDPITQLMLSDKNLRSINSKLELPCFYTVMGLLNIARQMKVGILLKVKRADHTVEPDPRLPFEVQIPMAPLGDNMQEPIIVIEAIKGGQEIAAETREEYLGRLLKHDLQHLVAMNCAIHPQYSDNGCLETVPLLAIEAKEKDRLTLLASAAKELGCCMENIRLLRVTHIFCDSIGSQMKKTESKNG